MIDLDCYPCYNNLDDGVVGFEDEVVENEAEPDRAFAYIAEDDPPMVWPNEINNAPDTQLLPRAKSMAIATSDLPEVAEASLHISARHRSRACGKRKESGQAKFGLPVCD
ncbi:MAG TPA: hypothetical protein VMT61_11700 [Candidatus Binataceae bacterium]|nr:hypothetical protein [Candidatus Binataceae bacterium]